MDKQKAQTLIGTALAALQNLEGAVNRNDRSAAKAELRTVKKRLEELRGMMEDKEDKPRWTQSHNISR